MQARSALPTVSAVIPAYRDLHLLDISVPALLVSQGVEFEAIIVNNDPSQDVQQWARERGHPVRVIEAGHNSGFCAANNRGARESSGEWVFFCNDDLVVSPSYLSEIVAFLAARPGAGAGAGKLLRYDIAARRPLTTIDSAGMALRRSHAAYDRGESQQDRGQFDAPEQVFGVSAAGLVARRAALEDIALAGDYFDETLFMYKEDVDLAWRLALRGWDSWYVPSAVAWHGRTSRGLAGAGYLARPGAYFRNERAKPAFVRMHSLKNQWLLLARNESMSSAGPDLAHILARETLVSLAALALSPQTFAAAAAGFVRALRPALRRRGLIQRRAIVPSADVRRRWAGV